MSDPQCGIAVDASKGRRPWRPSTVLIVALAAIIGLNEAQRIMAQWQAHGERQVQLIQARSNGMKLDKVMAQNDLELQLLTRRSIVLDRLILERQTSKPPR